MLFRIVRHSIGPGAAPVLRRFRRLETAVQSADDELELFARLARRAEPHLALTYYALQVFWTFGGSGPKKQLKHTFESYTCSDHAG
jgi:hypothetical protein